MSISSAMIEQVERLTLASERFVLITNNCWGADVYTTLGRPYNTPFVGLYVPGPSYINLLNDFERKISSQLTFVDRSPLRNESYPFPVALLGDDVEVHFMHYASAQEAQEKWSRRVERLRRALDAGAALRVKFCDRDPENGECLQQFHLTPLGAKVSFGVRQLPHPNHLCVPPEGAGTCVPNGPRLYRKRYRHFDFCDWLKHGAVGHTARSRLLSVLR